MLWDTYGRPEPRRWGAVLPGLTGTVPHHLTVDGTADAVVQLHVELGQNVRCDAEGTDVTGDSHGKGAATKHQGACWTPTVKDAGFRDVSHSRCLHDVPDDKLLDGLVLGDTTGTVGAADGLHVATALLGTTVIPPFLGLQSAHNKDRLQLVVHIKLQINEMLNFENIFRNFEMMPIGSKPTPEYLHLQMMAFRGPNGGL